MLISKHHVKEHGWTKAILYSLASIIIVHLLVIVVHELVDESSPHDPVVYPIDRGLEYIEVGWSWFWGHEARIETHLSHAMERFSEVEEVIATASGSLRHEAHADELLHSGYNSLSAATALLNHSDDNHHNDLHLFSTVLLAESITDDFIARLENMGQQASDHLKADLTMFLNLFQEHRKTHSSYASRFEIEDELATKLRQEVEARVHVAPPPPPVVNDTDPDTSVLEAAPVCADAGRPCARSTDCCDTLFCSAVFTNQGRQKRCMVPRH